MLKIFILLFQPHTAKYTKYCIKTKRNRTEHTCGPGFWEPNQAWPDGSSLTPDLLPWHPDRLMGRCKPWLEGKMRWEQLLSGPWGLRSNGPLPTPTPPGFPPCSLPSPLSHQFLLVCFMFSISLLSSKALGDPITFKSKPLKYEFFSILLVGFCSQRIEPFPGPWDINVLPLQPASLQRNP